MGTSWRQMQITLPSSERVSLMSGETEQENSNTSSILPKVTSPDNPQNIFKAHLLERFILS